MLKIVQRKNSPYWIARGTINGNRVEVSTKCTSKAEARRAILEITARYSANQIGAKGLTYDQATQLFIENKPKARFYELPLSYFNNTPVSEIGNAAMREAARDLYPNATPATVNRQLYAPVSAVINYAAGDDLCAPVKFRKPEGASGNKRTHFVMPEAANLIIEKLALSRNGYLPALVTLLFGQGLRVSEALGIDGKADIFLDERIIVLRDPKNGCERQLTLIPRVVAALSTLPTIGEAGPIFRKSDGMPYPLGNNSGGQIKSPFRRAVELAGVDPRLVTPHTCRHSWATWFYAQTKDPLALQNAGGWLSNEWQRYTKFGTPQLAQSAFEAGWDFRLSGGVLGESTMQHENEQRKSML